LIVFELIYFNVYISLMRYRQFIWGVNTTYADAWLM